jgi:UDP-N-acetylglucosamine--N-acetylmuramyl-(pentapeptide) pyrophosphoryl-undecaprenol N-acetylglucosamine transferase
MGNAQLLAAAGAAEVISSADLTPDLLADRLAALLGDLPALARMGRAARSLARPRAVADIADRLEALAGMPGMSERVR